MRDLVRFVVIPALVGGLVGLAVMFADGGNKPGYADAVRRAAPAVVNIYSSKKVRPPICELPRFQEWCDSMAERGSQRLQSSLGSGVVVTEDGYILTNNHVIASADEILVAFNNGQATTATLVGSDPETDLAVIRVNATGLTAIALSRADNVQVGDIALAIGNPFGIGQTVSSGIISATGRARISQSPYDDFLQTDAAINPGNSGGALIDAEGRLLGINTLIISRTGGSQGIGFAIPAELALDVMAAIIRDGRVRRGWLGLELGSLAGGAGGLIVTTVLPGSPAALAGIRSGDRLIEVAGYPAENPADISQVIAASTPGAVIAMTVVRGDDLLTIEVVSGERPAPEA
jgi:serine protease DegS